MKKTILLPVVVGIAAAIIILAIAFTLTQKPIPLNENPTPVNEIPSNKTTFSYVNSNSIMKSVLSSKGISMSSPLKFSGDSISKYCIFYGDDVKQNSVEYCTSTELKDSEGKFLGNIHMTGSKDSPNTVLGVIQTDPFMTQLDSVKTVYQTMVESLVCDCWQAQKPGGLTTVSAWVDAAKSHHLEGKHTTSTSQIDGLAKKQLFLEITTNTKGYLWKFIITN
ncbi:MAG: hypothetical protein K8Q89_01845 [Nitrosarchaeum sp.]|nr:hypothetical protein [Nitrosarchaeum sp.]